MSSPHQVIFSPQQISRMFPMLTKLQITIISEVQDYTWILMTHTRAFYHQQLKPRRTLLMENVLIIIISILCDTTHSTFCHIILFVILFNHLLNVYNVSFVRFDFHIYLLICGYCVSLS